MKSLIDSEFFFVRAVKQSLVIEAASFGRQPLLLSIKINAIFTNQHKSKKLHSHDKQKGFL